jgi:hypothetical protein
MTASVRAAVAAALLAVAGCDSTPKTYPVTGTVTLDGQPIPDGDIIFLPADTAVAPEPGKIVGGRYTLNARVGVKKVSISASKIIPGGARGGGNEPVPEEYVPERYNDLTELTAEVVPDGTNTFDFRLTTKK